MSTLTVFCGHTGIRAYIGTSRFHRFQNLSNAHKWCFRQSIDKSPLKTPAQEMDLENDVMGIDPEANKNSSPRATPLPWFLDVIGVFDACRRLSFEKSTWRSCLHNSRLVIVTIAVARSKDFTWKMSFSKSNQKTEKVPNKLFSGVKFAKHKQSVKRKTQWNGWKQTWPSAFHNKITRTMPYPTNHLACHDFVHLHKVKFTKYCTCHQKIDWWIECKQSHWKCDKFIARMTPNTQAVKVQELKLHEFCKTASKHASSRLERKICQMLPPKEGQFDPAHDPSMIGEWSEHDPRINPSVRNPLRNWGYFSRSRRAFS